MTIFFIAVLLLFGLLLLVLEILVLPGLIAGILGAVFLVMGIGWTWQVYGADYALLTAVITVLIGALAIWSALKTGFWARFSLQDQLNGKMNEIDLEKISVGDRGAAVSSLRPMGTVRINGIKMEATSEGEMIPPNYPVQVVKIESNKVFVAPVR